MKAAMKIMHIMNPEITFYRRVHRGVLEFARSQADLELRTEGNASIARVRALDHAGYDGLVLDAIEAWPKEVIDRFRTPAVTVSNTGPGTKVPRVVTDDCEVGRIAARHLLAKGYHHFAFWGDPAYVFAQQRWSGFAEAILGARGKGCTPARSAAHPRSVGRWLRRLPRPVGLMAMNDQRASLAIDACHDLGLRIPEDVAVVGVDDDDLYSDLTTPALSSVALQTDRIGYLAAECLVRLVQGAKIPPVTPVPPGPLIARQSSRGVASTDALVAKAVQFLEQNLARGSNIEELAGAVGTSRRSLELRFKAVLGQTPGQTLARLRIEQAQGLLVTSSLPLKKIAMLSGFSNQVRMSEAFRRHTDQTPMAYRRAFWAH
jgi:LacI family transcriptional regulator